MNMGTRRLHLTTGAGYQFCVPPDRPVVVLNDALEVVDLPAGLLTPGQILPLRLGNPQRMVPREVPLPVLDQCYYAGDQHVRVPDSVTPELAELVGYFMGDGSLHAKGLRFCVAYTDPDVVDRLIHMGKHLFAIDAAVTPCEGYWEVAYRSVRLARWWDAAGFAKGHPSEPHVGKGWTPHVPLALRETNNPEVLGAFLRGLFEADGTVQEQVPSFATSSPALADETRKLLLSFGLLTTTRTTRSGYGSTIQVVRLRNRDHAVRFRQLIGFMSARKAGLVACDESPQAGNRDRIFLPRSTWEEILPTSSTLRRRVISSLAKSGGVSRRTAEEVAAQYPSDRLGRALVFGYETLRAALAG
jgi:ribonucleoside-diphosphate reductase alpha chain